MKRNNKARTVVTILLLSLGLALSSCVVYEEPGPYYGHHGWNDHDHWR